MAQVEIVAIYEKFREIVELWDELLDVVDVAEEVLPGLGNGVKLSIGDVKSARLEIDVKWGEGLNPDEIVQDHGRVGVVCAIVEFGDGAARILELLELVLDLCHVFRVLNSDRLREVTERLWVRQVELKDNFEYPLLHMHFNE